ncbi:FAD-binding protein [Stappia sp. ES.058]|uniref:FAD-binding protein n=1 Tax=Stappia sp. ES.058 TaxID=1881061 RepID=UPI000879E12C|nr:FAD-binding protein [Stappia sp. ES.058]SDT91028.1 glycolate oxidase FAD binding subunit [Stappia sp. ES.058]
MSDRLSPRSAEEVREAVQWAAAEQHPLEVLGTGSKRVLGRPVQAGHALDLSGLSGIALYEPAELVISALAGTPLAEIEAALEEHNQELAFDPIDYGPLLAQAPGAGTVGGMIGANLAGSKRLKFGAARDHILGMEAVSGRGEIFKSGGRVVKNVTGYDLPRTLTGSWGTLAVATRITLKVQPKAETEATFLISGLNASEATQAMTAAMGSSAEVSAAAHLPPDIAATLATQGHALNGSATLLRLEGFATSVDYRFGALKTLLRDSGTVSRLDAEASRALWRDVRDCRAFAGTEEHVWRISVAPTAGAEFIARVQAELSCRAYFDWSGGLVWLALSDKEPQAEAVRAAVEVVGGGHAMLVRAPAPVRSSIEVFQPQPSALAALSARIKAQFDPHGILNPGRMGS